MNICSIVFRNNISKIANIQNQYEWKTKNTSLTIYLSISDGMFIFTSGQRYLAVVVNDA